MQQEERPQEQPTTMPEAELREEPKAQDGQNFEAKNRRPTA